MSRERSYAPDEATPAAADVVSRAQVHNRVVSALLDLEDPYRKVLLMRFFDDLPPRMIAADLAIPVSTVETRIQRGLRRLRERLDRIHDGDRERWLGALGLAIPKTAGPVGVIPIALATTALLGAAALLVNIPTSAARKPHPAPRQRRARNAARGWLDARGGRRAVARAVRPVAGDGLHPGR